ncbi:MAG TPA: hypothetical protein VFI17_12800 [Solirubrobacterales bacterium]|nr:hypothetical protein [Solirubrobacterales bacterium]
MRELLDRSVFGVEVDEGLARRELRRQIGQLEYELSGLVAEAFGRVEIESHVAAGAAAPRVLGLGELERVRDDLAERIGEARLTLAERARVESERRELLRRMLADPQRFKWLRISRADVGEPGCGGWHSRPVLGPVGMLTGWWRVKVSSGCPLAGRLAAVDHEGKSETGFEARREAAGAVG